jgi:pimeloyl-ACP methyl ester carboxylesterase
MANQIVRDNKGQSTGAWPPRHPGWRAAACATLVCVLAIVSGCASLDEWGRAKVYRPAAVDGAQAWQSLLADSPGAQTIFVPVGSAGEQLAVVRVPARLGGPAAAINVLYLHGTFRHAAKNLPKTVPMAASGLTVFVPDYRGWGISSPRLPSEASIHEDAWAVWQALQKNHALDARGQPVKWIIYGHSMGSAVAVHLAARLQGQGRYCALVLESSLTNFSDVAYAAASWPGRWLVAMSQQRMDALARIGAVTPPVWFMHGENDNTVPMALGKRLYEAAPEPKHWAQWPLDHSNLQTDPTGRYSQTWREIRADCEKP